MGAPHNRPLPSANGSVWKTRADACGLPFVKKTSRPDDPQCSHRELCLFSIQGMTGDE
jgi:hypothetical protein